MTGCRSDADVLIHPARALCRREFLPNQNYQGDTCIHAYVHTMQSKHNTMFLFLKFSPVHSNVFLSKINCARPRDRGIGL